MKSFVFLLIITAHQVMADTTVVDAPTNRFATDTIYAEWDSLNGFALNGSGNSQADQAHQISNAILNQATGIGTPGGLVGSPGDQRVYTFDQAADWTITATADISYNTLTLRVLERFSDVFTDPNAPVTGHTGYNVTLNNILPTNSTVVPITQIISIGDFTFELDLAITTFTWNLSSSTTQINLSLIGSVDLHDSVDAFVLDAETIAPPTPTPAPNLTIEVINNQIVLTWPDNFPGTVESTTDLSDSDSWQDITTTPTQSNGEFQLTLSLPNPLEATFFRLRYPTQ